MHAPRWLSDGRPSPRTRPLAIGSAVPPTVGPIIWAAIGTLRLAPTLNQSLWTLLIASLSGLIGWGVVHMSAQAAVAKALRVRHRNLRY